jgi:hypothetical protein
MIVLQLGLFFPAPVCCIRGALVAPGVKHFGDARPELRYAAIKPVQKFQGHRLYQAMPLAGYRL